MRLLTPILNFDQMVHHQRKILEPLNQRLERGGEELSLVSLHRMRFIKVLICIAAVSVEIVLC